MRASDRKDLYDAGLWKLEHWASENCVAHVKVDQAYAEMMGLKPADWADEGTRREQGDTDKNIEEPEGEKLQFD